MMKKISKPLVMFSQKATLPLMSTGDRERSKTCPDGKSKSNGPELRLGPSSSAKKSTSSRLIAPKKMMLTLMRSISQMMKKRQF